MKALHLTAIIATILFFAIPERLDSCGIGAPLPVFVTLEGPADVAQFLKGKLGVLRRSYHPRHLIGAFRVLSGLPLTDGGIDSLYQQSGGGGTPYFGVSRPSEKFLIEPIRKFLLTALRLKDGANRDESRGTRQVGVAETG